MTMKTCPICGEKYSDTYNHCPFCEEEEELQEGEGGRRIKKRKAGSLKYRLITPTLVVVIFLMAGLLFYLLWGDRVAKRLGGGSSGPSSSTAEQSGATGGDDASDIMEPPAGTDDPDTGQGTGALPTGSGTAEGGETEPEDPEFSDYEQADALPSGLSLNLTDFTVTVLGEVNKLRVLSGGSGSYTWISQDPGIASVDQEGKVTAVSGGTTNVIVTDGSRKGVCIVRVRASGSLNTSSGSSASGSSGSGSSTGSGTYKLNNTDFTRPISEGSYQLKVSGSPGSVTWTSSNTSVATVSDSGLVTPIAHGTATITATCDGQALTCIVRVP